MYLIHHWYVYVFRSGTCSSLCNCSFSNFEPVCGDENLTYFSPCQAGCLRSTQDKVRVSKIYIVYHALFSLQIALV